MIVICAAQAIRWRGGHWLVTSGQRQHGGEGKVTMAIVFPVGAERGDRVRLVAPRHAAGEGFYEHTGEEDTVEWTRAKVIRRVPDVFKVRFDDGILYTCYPDECDMVEKLAK